jgi:hypothetical protein
MLHLVRSWAFPQHGQAASKDSTLMKKGNPEVLG